MVLTDGYIYSFTIHYCIDLHQFGLDSSRSTSLLQQSCLMSRLKYGTHTEYRINSQNLGQHSLLGSAELYVFSGVARRGQGGQLPRVPLLGGRQIDITKQKQKMMIGRTDHFGKIICKCFLKSNVKNGFLGL